MFTKSISSNALKTIFGSVRGVGATAVSFIHLGTTMNRHPPHNHTHTHTSRSLFFQFVCVHSLLFSFLCPFCHSSILLLRSCCTLFVHSSLSRTLIFLSRFLFTRIDHPYAHSINRTRLHTRTISIIHLVWAGVSAKLTQISSSSNIS